MNSNEHNTSCTVDLSSNNSLHRSVYSVSFNCIISSIAEDCSILGALLLSWGSLSSEPLCQSTELHIRGELFSYNDEQWLSNVGADRDGEYAAFSSAWTGGVLSDHQVAGGAACSTYAGTPCVPDQKSISILVCFTSTSPFCASASPSTGGRLNGLMTNFRLLTIKARSSPTPPFVPPLPPPPLS